MTNDEIEKQFNEKFTHQGQGFDFELVLNKGNPHAVLRWFMQLLSEREKAAFEEGREFEHLEDWYTDYDGRYIRPMKDKELGRRKELKSKYYGEGE